MSVQTQTYRLHELCPDLVVVSVSLEEVRKTLLGVKLERLEKRLLVCKKLEEEYSWFINSQQGVGDWK